MRGTVWHTLFSIYDLIIKFQIFRAKINKAHMLGIIVFTYFYPRLTLRIFSIEFSISELE